MADADRSGPVRPRDRADIVGLIRTRDWAATSLGAPRTWPARLQHLVEHLLRHPLPGFVLCGRDRLLLYNGAFAELRGADHPQAFGRPVRDALPDGWAEMVRSVDRAFRGEAVTTPVHWPWLCLGAPGRLVLTPVTDRDGTVGWVHGQIMRAPEAERGEDEVRDNERRLRLALEVGRLAMWDWDMVTGDITWSDEHFRMEGYEIGEVEPSYEAWSSRIHPEDRAATTGALAEARDTRRLFDREFRFLRPDGSVVWVSSLGQFFYDADGPVRMIGVMQNVTERREWADAREVLIGELQHRTRNLIGIVGSLARRTGDRSGSLDDFMSRFGHRLDALARVQALLSRLGDGDRVTFDELLRCELGALDALDGDRHVTLDGPPDVRLRSSTVQTFALALHELATNAAKYGALKDGGHLLVRWRVQEGAVEPTLRVEWIESGVEMPEPGSAPRGGGYGRELIERALPYQLGARTTYELGRDGVRCTITLPVCRAAPMR